MRILTVANHIGSRGGLERTQLTMCRGLAARGHEIDLAFMQAGDFEPEWRSFARRMVHIDYTLPHSSQPLRSSLGCGRAIRAVRGLAPDLVYVYRPLDVPFAVAVGRLCRAPVVLHLCLPLPHRISRLVRFGLRHVDLTVSVSRSTAGLWYPHGLRREATQIVYTGIDMDHYAPAAEAQRRATKEALAIDPSAFMVLYCGRLAGAKGVDVLVRAFTRLVADAPQSRLVVVGGASVSADPDVARQYADELRRMAGEAPVLFLGHRKDVLPLIQAADLVVAPSRWQEPLSRSVIEPLACGVPVIATRVGGNPEILTDWLDEFLFPPDDAEALERSMRSLLGWRASDPDLGERCRKSVETRLSLTREVEELDAALRALGRGAPARAA